MLCVLLESPHRGDSNEYKQYTIFNILLKITLNYPKSSAMGFYSKGLKNEFETAVVNGPSVFEPLKFYCIYFFEVNTKCILSNKCMLKISVISRMRSIFLVFTEKK